MLFSVVIRNWNGKLLLRNCLESLQPGLTNVDSEIIVVDNRSTDGSVEMVEVLFPSVQVIVPDSAVSAPAATNIGIRASRGEVLINVDNDVEMLTNNWVEHLVEPLDLSDRAGIIGCKIVDSSGRVDCLGGRISPWRLHGIVHIKKDDGDSPWRNVDYVPGTVFLMTRRVIERIGLWDEQYSPLYFDDTEYCARARRHGFEVICNFNVTVKHQTAQKARVGRSKSCLARIYHRNRLKFCRNHFRGFGIIPRVPMETGVAMEAMFRGTAMSYLRAWFDFVRSEESSLRSPH